MNRNEPPRVATWLLRHFGSSPTIEAIVGDLDERYASGRSRLWYWCQVLVTILVTFFQHVSRHKLLAVRALVLASVIKVSFLSGVQRLPSRLFGSLESYLFLFAGTVAVMMLTGWILARTHTRAMVLLYIPVELAWCCVVLTFRGLLFVHSWVFAVAPCMGTLFSRLGMINTIAALWVSAGITAMSFLVGAGFFTSTEPAASTAPKRSSI
jgi:hypothetical protein